MYQLDIVSIKIAIQIYFYELILRRTLIYKLIQTQMIQKFFKNVILKYVYIF